MSNKEQTATVKSISRAADILFCLSNGVNTITEIARYCNLSKSTAHRLLKALKESSLVTQDPNNQQYHLGPLIVRLSSNPRTSHNYLVTLALEEMKRIRDIAEETVTLNIMVGIQYVRLYEIPSRHDLRVIDTYDPIGPIFVGATARVLLSQLNETELQSTLHTVRISNVTGSSITEKQMIKKRLKIIHQQGFEVSHGERIPGSMCVSAPIKKYAWPAALSVVGPETRFKTELDTITHELIEGTNHISANIDKFMMERR